MKTEADKRGVDMPSFQQGEGRVVVSPEGERPFWLHCQSLGRGSSHELLYTHRNSHICAILGCRTYNLTHGLPRDLCRWVVTINDEADTSTIG